MTDTVHFESKEELAHHILDRCLAEARTQEERLYLTNRR